MPADDLTLLIEAATEAGEIARSFWREDPKVWDKGGDDPVTEADFAVDRHLRTRLMKARPDYGWISEETEDDPARHDATHVFICDPIDGTRAFVAGEPTWAHSLAVARDGLVVAACVLLPVAGKLYAAAQGGGALLNDVPIAASDREDTDGAAILSPKVTFRDENWRDGPPNVVRHFRPSLAYRLSLVAEGRFDGMLTLRPSWEWDIAAGSLIATEAGAAVSDRRGGALRFNSPSRQTAGVIAASKGVHRGLLERLA